MTIERIQKLGADTEAKRHQADLIVVAANKRLGEAVAQYLAEQSGSLRQMARELGVSAPYLHDIRMGRRKISLMFLDKLVAWGRK